MRLLVTRPQPDADLTAARLRDAGHEPIVEPVLSTTFLPPPVQLTDHAALALTSRNAVRAVGRWGNPRVLTTPAYVVGAATAAAAAAAGFTDIHVSNGDGTALATTIRASLAPTARPILYPTAPDRSESLETELAAAGFTVVPIHAYQMVPSSGLSASTQQALQDGTLDGVLLYSARTSTVLLSLLRAANLVDSLAELRVFALSQQVAAPLSGVPNLSLAVADRPEETSLFALLGQEQVASKSV